MTWGIVPAAGSGSRIQPLAFSKELLPVGGGGLGGDERPRAVSRCIVDRMILGGATRICMVIGPGKGDILEHHGGEAGPARLFYAVQPSPAGLCDAIFRALPLLHPDDHAIVGLPDTIWYPEDALCHLDDGELSFLLFPVETPSRFDAVVTDEGGRVVCIQVKAPDAATRWIWGAFKAPGHVLAALFDLYCERGRRDEYVGTLVNAFLERGGRARGVRAGASYLDVGTLDGYREALGKRA